MEGVNVHGAMGGGGIWTAHDDGTAADDGIGQAT